MKIELEKIETGNSSFSWLINPKLNDFYFWHFHPELELVFIEAPEGTRHVGHHRSKFYGSDMVLIGSNIPHLNFDFGIKSEYQKIVLHLKQDFLENASLNTPELKSIHDLLENAKYGLVFGSATKDLIGEKLKNIYRLPFFEQFLAVVKILNLMAESKDYQRLHSSMPDIVFNQKEKNRLKVVFDYIDANYHSKISLDEIAQICCLSNAAFCRYFKKNDQTNLCGFFEQCTGTSRKN